MTKFFQSTLGMFTLFLLGALTVYVIAAGFQGTWNPFTSNGSNVRLLQGIDTSREKACPCGDFNCLCGIGDKTGIRV